MIIFHKFVCFAKRDNTTMKRFLILTAALINFMACSQGPILKIGLITDIHHADKDARIGREYRLSADKLSDAIDIFNREDVDMMISLGDLVDNDIHNYSIIDSVFHRFDGPVFKVLGNHDFIAPYSEERQDSVFRVMGIKDRYQSIKKKRIRLLLLDGTDIALFSHSDGSEGYQKAKRIIDSLKNTGSMNHMRYNGGIGKQQMEWITNELELADRENDHVICFCHMPMMPPGGKHTLFNSPEVTRIFAENPCVKAVITGHHHPGGYEVTDGIHYLSLQGLVEGKENSFSIAEIYKDRIVIKGFGREEGRIMEFNK